MRLALKFGAMALFLVGVSHARDWGFSKDTVYGWNPGGDTVLLTNQGTDSLRIDTLNYEVVEPPDLVGVQYSFYYEPPTNTYSYYGIHPIPSGHIDTLFDFYFDQGAIVKAAVTQAEGDTIVARLFFEADSDRGRDTLVYKGIQMISGSIQSSKFFEDGRTNPVFYDPEGRRQYPPSAQIISNIPLLSPNK